MPREMENGKAPGCERCQVESLSSSLTEMSRGFTSTLSGKSMEIKITITNKSLKLF